MHLNVVILSQIANFPEHCQPRRWQLNFSKKKWAVLSVVELFTLHLLCCSSMIHAHMRSLEIIKGRVTLRRALREILLALKLICFLCSNYGVGARRANWPIVPSHPVLQHNSFIELMQLLQIIVVLLA